MTITKCTQRDACLASYAMACYSDHDQNISIGQHQVQDTDAAHGMQEVRNW